MGQNAVSQSDYRIFKSTVSLEKTNKKDWIWLKNIGVGVFKNGCGHSVPRTLKLAVCQRIMNKGNWFFVRWYKFKKAKSYFNKFFMELVKNGCGLLLLGALCWYKFRKANNHFNNY